MNHMQILQRAWKILWSYRALWIFGIIIALTAGTLPHNNNGGGGGGASNHSSSSYLVPASYDLRHPLDQINGFFSQLSTGEERILIAIIIALICLAVALFVIFRTGYYLSQVAQVRMVDGLEARGEKLSWKQGLRLGWSRAAWRLFLIDLVIFVPVVIGFIILFAVAALPAVLGSLAGNAFMVVGVMGTVGLALGLIVVALMVAIALSLTIEIIRRVCILQGLGVIASIRLGWQSVRRSLKDLSILWLILVGVRLGLIILMIPIVLALVILGLVTGGGAGAIAYLIIQGVANATAGWIFAAILGVLLFFSILGLPLLFLGGLKETYLSTTWTLAYRELNAPVSSI